MVKAGDTVGGIAQRFGLRSAELRELNGIEGDKIRVGQILQVSPGSGASKAPAAAQPSSSQAASSQASAPKTPIPASGLYEVKSGDTVSTIAERFGLKSAQLRELNDLANDNIRIGQKLRLSGSAASQLKPAAASASAGVAPSGGSASGGSASGGSYEVKSGDTVSTIAERFGMKSAELRELNGLANDNIRIGQKLKVSGRAASGSSSSSSSSSSSRASSAQAGTVYEVKSGDTVSTIAERFGLKSAELRQINELSNDNIRIGQKLKVKK